MNDQTQSLERIAREVLGVIERHGADWVRGSQYHAPHLTYGLEHGLFDQTAVDAAQTTHQNTQAREVLGTVELMGIDFVRGNQYHAPHLTYGLEHGLFDQTAVDAAQTTYQNTQAREVLGVIERHGADWVRGGQYHAPHLTYGLEHGLFDQTAVDAAHRKYESTQRK